MSWTSLRSAFVMRWRGDVPLHTVLWRDMLLVGTVVNLVTGMSALVMLVAGVDVQWAVMVHFAPVPLNLLLAHAVFRAPQADARAKAIAVAWFAAMLVL